MVCLLLAISLEFERSSYEVNENSGPSQPVLVLDAALECCSIAVTVIVENVTAKGYVITIVCMIIIWRREFLTYLYTYIPMYMLHH